MADETAECVAAVLENMHIAGASARIAAASATQPTLQRGICNHGPASEHDTVPFARLEDWQSSFPNLLLPDDDWFPDYAADSPVLRRMRTPDRPHVHLCVRRALDGHPLTPGAHTRAP